MKKVDLGQIKDNLDYFKSNLALYGDVKNFPPAVAADMLKLIADSEELAYGELIQPDLTPLNGSSPYFANPKKRRQEISSSAGVYGLASKNEEAAFAFMVNYLEKSASRPENLIEKINIISQLFIEILEQNPTIIDLRAMPVIQSAYRSAVQEHRARLYQSAITSDWSKVKDRFDQTQEFYFDLGEFKVFPCVLNLEGEESMDFATKPGNQLGQALSYEKAEDAVIQQTQAFYKAKDQNMTFTHLKAVNWNSGAYSSRVENELYNALKTWINTQIESFKHKHGGDVTKIMLIKANETKYTVLGGNEIYLGYKIMLK